MKRNDNFNVSFNTKKPFGLTASNRNVESISHKSASEISIYHVESESSRTATKDCILTQDDEEDFRRNGRPAFQNRFHPQKYKATECNVLIHRSDEASSLAPTLKKNISAAPIDCIEISDSDEEAEMFSEELQPLDFVSILNKFIRFGSTSSEQSAIGNRKLLDAIAVAMKFKAHEFRLSVNELINKDQLVLPIAILTPPSQTVELLTVYDSDISMKDYMFKMPGKISSELTALEVSHKQSLKSKFPAPAMTELLMNIGLDLVRNTTYSDLIDMENLSEIPKNIAAFRKLAQRLEPCLKALIEKNRPYELPLLCCQQCLFKTESRIVLAIHLETAHFDCHKHQCGLCAEYSINEHIIDQQYSDRNQDVSAINEWMWAKPGFSSISMNKEKGVAHCQCNDEEPQTLEYTQDLQELFSTQKERAVQFIKQQMDQGSCSFRENATK